VLFKVPELGAEVDVRDIGMDTHVSAVPVRPAALTVNDDVSSDTEVLSVHSTDTSDDDVDFSDENLNNDEDSESVEDMLESPSPDAAAAVAAAGVDMATVPPESGSHNLPAFASAASNVIQPAVPVTDLDNSLSCFTTTKRKKPVVVSPPVSKDDDADEAEVPVSLHSFSENAFFPPVVTEVKPH